MAPASQGARTRRGDSGRDADEPRTSAGAAQTRATRGRGVVPDARRSVATGRPGSIDGEATAAPAYTDGNQVTVLVDGRAYYERLLDELTAAPGGSIVHFTDWRGDPDERLDGPGSEIARVLAELAARGVAVRGLVWRSHPDEAHFSEQENLHLVETVNAGGRRGAARRTSSPRRQPPPEAVRHPPPSGRPSATSPSSAGSICAMAGTTTRGTRVTSRRSSSIAGTDRARRGTTCSSRCAVLPSRTWPGRSASVGRTRPGSITGTRGAGCWRHAAAEPDRPSPLPPPSLDPPPAGEHAVQVLRTYAAKRPPFPFAPDGERSIARAYLKAFARARRLVYVEDQYLWSRAACRRAGRSPAR